MKTKEQKAAYQKEYMKTYKLSDEQREKKKAYMKEYNKKWNEENKEKVKAYDKEYKAKLHGELHHVYLLKDDHYIGVTSSIKNRFWKHKHEGRNTDNYRIMYSTLDRAKALEIEKQYHGMGFFGAN